MSSLPSLLVLLTPGLKQLAMREEGLVCDLGLVLLPNPVPSLVVSHSVLENHYLHHLLGFWVREPALGDEVRNALGQGMYPFIRLLPNVREWFILVGPKVLLGLNGSCDSI